MTRKSIFSLRLLRILGLAATLLNGTGARAQFSRVEESGSIPEQVMLRESMLKGIGGMLYECIDFNSNDRYWDSSMRHYRGRMLRALRYPELVRSGYRSFSLLSLQSDDGVPDLKYGTPESILQQTAAAAARDNGRETKRYHFDDSGWLRAIRFTNINPAYESFAEASDSLFYDFHPDGSAQLRWKHEYYSTGSGRGSGRSGCPPPPPFLAIRKSELYVADFDAWQNLTAYTFRGGEIWDTCHGEGPVYLKRSLAYDPLGRLLSVVESSDRYPGPAAETRVSYEDLPYERFEDAVRGNYQYAPLREATIRNRVLKQEPLQAIMLRRTSMNYLHYDYRLRGNSYRPDSPRVDHDTGIYIVNRAMERVAFRPGGHRQAIAITDRGTDSATGVSMLRIQSLPVPPDPDAGPVTVCDPLALGSSFTRGVLRSALGRDTLIRFLGSDAGSDNYPGASPKLQFSPLPPTQLSRQLRSMALLDQRGLLKYLWSGGNTFQLSYQP